MGKRAFLELSEQEQQEVCQLYDDGEKVKDIIEKYHLDLTPSQLGAALPLKPISQECKYCHIPLGIRRTRSTYGQNEPTCPNCGHIEYDTEYYYSFNKPVCKCKNCQLEEMEKAKAIRESIEKAHPVPTLQKSDKDLELDDRVNLYILFLCFGLDVGNMSFTCHFKKMNIDIDHDYVIDIVKALYEQRLIYIDVPRTPTENFDLNKETMPCCIEDTTFKVNVDFTEENVKKLRREDYSITKYSPVQQKRILKKIMLICLRRNLNILMKERGFESPNFNIIKFEDMLNNICYSQIIHLEYKNAQYCVDKQRTDKWPNYKIQNGISTFIYNSYLKHIENNWSIYKSNLDFTEDLLRAFVTKFLERDITILNSTLDEIFPRPEFSNMTNASDDES